MILLGYHGIQVFYDPGLFKPKPKILLEQLLMNLITMKKNQYQSSEFQVLLAWLDIEYKTYEKKAEKMLEQGKISFDCLWYIFPKSGKVFGLMRQEQAIGMKIDTRM
jgi:hypothetical protein